MQNTEYEREFSWDIDAYLIENYPTMNMATRRSICARSLAVLTSDDLWPYVDEEVSTYAKEKQGWEKVEEEYEEEDEEELDD